tara:strand:- start:42765 stop:42989 length:225 start_codon:yes stop_codon:yes gene_type:complete
MTSSNTRLYLVEGPLNSKTLVEATSQAQAQLAVTKGVYSSRAASAMEVAGLIADGAKVVKAGKVPVPEGVPENV